MQNEMEDVGRRPRVLVADDHSLIRERVTSLLGVAFEIVAVVENGKDLLDEAVRLHPEVIVLDITMPEINGLDAARKLRSLGSSAKIVFLTVHDQVQFVRRCMSEGAMGYVVKSRLETDLVHAIQEALSDRHYISPPLFR